MGCKYSNLNSNELYLVTQLHYQGSYIQNLMKMNKFYLPAVYAISNDNRRIAISKYNTRIDIYDINFEKVTTISTSNNVHSLIFSNTNDNIIYGTNEGSVHIKDLETTNIVESFSYNNYTGIISKINISECGIYLSYLLEHSNTDDEYPFILFVLSLNTSSIINHFKSKSRIIDLYFTKDSNYITFVNLRGKMSKHSLIGTEMSMITFDTLQFILTIRLFASCPSGLACITSDGTLYFFNSLDCKKKSILQKGLHHVTLLYISNCNDGEYIVFGTEQGTLYILNTNQKNNIITIQNSNYHIIEMLFSPDSEKLVVTYFKHPDTIVCTYNCNNGSMMSRFIIEREIKKKIKSKNDVQEDCVICLDSENDYAYVECGHKCVCYECGSKTNKCPICRKESSIIKIF
jgi:WD40 repeat protein